MSKTERVFYREAKEVSTRWPANMFRRSRGHDSRGGASGSCGSRINHLAITALSELASEKRAPRYPRALLTVVRLRVRRAVRSPTLAKLEPCVPLLLGGEPECLCKSACTSIGQKPTRAPQYSKLALMCQPRPVETPVSCDERRVVIGCRRSASRVHHGRHGW